MRAEEMNFGCAPMSLRLVKKWMNGWRRRHGGETRVMKAYVGPLTST